MNAQELIDELKAQGITLEWDGDSINWKAPFEFVPSDEIANLVKKNWDEIVKRIDGPPPEWLLSGTGIVRLTQGDCLGAMGKYPDNLVDLIVTDPPYGLKFMGKDWDKAVPSVEIWKECLRVLKPGGFAFIMSLPRQDLLTRMIVNLQDAGFNTDFTSLYWTYARGVPKARNIGKTIDKRAGAKRKVLDEHPLTKSGFFDKVDDKGRRYHQSENQGNPIYEYNPITEPATPEAKALDGSYAGYQPKPVVEVILIVQKPLSEKSYVDQALANKKGIAWLDDCRIPYADCGDSDTKKIGNKLDPRGRFPANLLVSDNILNEACTHAKGYSRMFSLDAWGNQQIAEGLNISDLEEVDQNVLPFLIVPKPSTKEKNFGCENITPQQVDNSRNDPNAIGCNNPRNRSGKQKKNFHPTVKPALLMSYLITLGSREGDIVLDPFCGSGTTCLAARLLKRPSIGIEKDPDYFKITAARMRALNQLSYFQQGSEKDAAGESANVLKAGKDKTSQKLRQTTKGWDKIKIKNETGEQVDAVAPLIISASRRNDTPACHSQWFMEGLKRGYLGVPKKIKYISFEKARLIVFWTKNPEPIIDHLDEIDRKDIGYYFQYTLNDNESERLLEPNIPPLEERITTFKKLSGKIGPEKVIWRFDPLILTDNVTKEQLVEKVENLMQQLAGHTEKLVISFYRSGDYKHALKRMQANKINPRDFKPEDITFVAEKIGALGKKFNMKIATCADKGDFSLFGIEPNKCIDDALIKRVFSDDKVLMTFLDSPIKLKDKGQGPECEYIDDILIKGVFKNDQELMAFLDSKKDLKDPGQRKECKCIVSEDVGSNSTCANGCLYCYANKSDKAVKKNLELIRGAGIGEFLVPQTFRKLKN